MDDLSGQMDETEFDHFFTICLETELDIVNIEAASQHTSHICTLFLFHSHIYSILSNDQ